MSVPEFPRISQTAWEYSQTGFGFLGFALVFLAPLVTAGPWMRRFTLSYGTALCWLIIGMVWLKYENEWRSRRRHAVEIEQAFNERLLPAAAFIRTFSNREHRLPTNEEMEQTGWQIGSIGGGRGRGKGITVYRDRPNFGRNGVEGRDFLLFTDISGWNLYYSSWDNKQTEASWP